MGRKIAFEAQQILSVCLSQCSSERGEELWYQTRRVEPSVGEEREERTLHGPSSAREPELTRVPVWRPEDEPHPVKLVRGEPRWKSTSRQLVR